MCGPVMWSWLKVRMPAEWGLLSMPWFKPMNRLWHKACRRRINMFYELMTSMKDALPGANLFSYITFRAGGALLTALLISFLLGPWLIDTLRAHQGKGQPIRKDGPASHLLTKVGTPTMGGLLILISSLGASLLWGDLSNMFLWAIMLTTLGFGAIGFADDF